METKKEILGLGKDTYQPKTVTKDTGGKLMEDPEITEMPEASQKEQKDLEAPAGKDSTDKYVLHSTDTSTTTTM